EFSVLEDVDLPNWVPYAKEFVDYAHSRGILCSVDLSLHMIQQKAFKLVQFPPKTLRPFKKQIDQKLDQLLSVGWDFINMEFATAEFVGGFARMRHRLRAYVVEKIRAHKGVKLIGRQHVVKPEDELGGKKAHSRNGKVEDADRGILIHTVMSYGIADSVAPVYELKNFRHLYDMLMAEDKVRETWYYPESAYWITFDNSVPMLILPYLSARFRDIQKMKKLGIPGHVTFSSGWEWGYWLVDWSIARWSWEYEMDGKVMARRVMEGVEKLFGKNEISRSMARAHQVQKTTMIDKNALRFLCPASSTDEFPSPFNKQFQPRPHPSWKELYNNPTGANILYLNKSMEQLMVLSQGLRKAVTTMRLQKGTPHYPDGLREILLQELMDALRITMRRAEFRHAWITILRNALQMRLEDNGDWEVQMETPLAQLEDRRQEALEIVQRQETRYRYPVSSIAREHENSYTAYEFGYLWPVSNLHFWSREIEQLREGKFSPFFMNIWDFGRIGGVKKK
ncbi:MAG: hypothetical protein AAF570_20820, partial [Bacteroidota bacterium]